MRSVVDRNVVLRCMAVLMRREFVDRKEDGRHCYKGLGEMG